MAKPKTDVFDDMLGWNGIQGYGNTIKRWVEMIWNIELDSLDEN
jgi:hypothetical protein